MKDEALELALYALDIVKIHFTQNRHVNEAITAIKQALAAPVYVKTFHGGKPWPLHPEPVQEPDHGDELTIAYMSGVHRGKELATQRQWVGLTDQERNQLWRDVVKWGDPSHDDVDLMKAIEAKLKEKNT